MNLLEIIMLILGIIIIILSCRIVGQPNNKKNGESLGSGDLKDIYLQEELNTFKEQQIELFNSVSEDTIVKTDDYLSKLSNEKIMAVSEYSDQILEKIARNHEEVVFLYNMLNHKEKELKEIIKDIDSAKRKAKELSNDNPQNHIAAENKEEKSKKLDNQAQNIKLQSVGKTASEQVDNNQSAISINNSEILKLHGQGKSIMDIAKQLGIGQGEVKLVVDLFVDK
ncbi:MAG: hypothetical protein GX271_05735 [Clostridiales bacterium]|nr:hypothetical protein [Clostridiales bacterium]